MPSYEYKCLDCGHQFLTVLTVSEHDKEKPPCPECGSKRVEQLFGSFFAKTSRKS